MEGFNSFVFSCVMWKPELSGAIFPIYYSDVLVVLVDWHSREDGLDGLLGTQLKATATSPCGDCFLNCISLLCPIARTDPVSQDVLLGWKVISHEW